MIAKLNKPNSASCMLVCGTQIASIYELKQDTHNAIKWFEILHGLLPNDGKVAARLGAIFQA